MFLSVKDADKRGLPALARRLAEMGFAILATRGTAARIRDAGLRGLGGQQGAGGPAALRRCDPLRRGATGDQHRLRPQSVADSFAIRRSALTHGVPHYTTMAGARAAVHAIAALKAGTLEVAPLQSYFRGSF